MCPGATFLSQVQKDGRTSANAPEPVVDVGADFGVFFDLHYRKVFRALLLMSGDRHEAEDVAQEAFVKLFEKWDRVGSMDDPTGYLYRTALNERRDRQRRILRWKRRSLFERGDPDATSVTAVARADIFRALGRLTEDQRAAVVLVEYVGMDPSEAAPLLGISADAARARLHRARVALREELHDDA